MRIAPPSWRRSADVVAEHVADEADRGPQRDEHDGEAEPRRRGPGGAPPRRRSRPRRPASVPDHVADVGRHERQAARRGERHDPATKAIDDARSRRPRSRRRAPCCGRGAAAGLAAAEGAAGRCRRRCAPTRPGPPLRRSVPVRRSRLAEVLLDGLGDVGVRVDLDDLVPLRSDLGDVRRVLAQVHEAEVVVGLDVLRVDRQDRPPLLLRLGRPCPG